MPNPSRPDLLPFALPVKVGMPYHGLVLDGQLQLPDSTTMAYEQPSVTGAQNEARAILIRGRSPSTDAITQTNAKYRWQNYALLSGRYRMIGGQRFGTANDATVWLYSDENGITWRVRYELTKTLSQFDLDVYLLGTFGLLSGADYSMTERLLGSYRFYSVHPYDGAVVVWTLASSTQSTHSQYGDVSMIWVDHNTTGAAPGYAVYHPPGADAIKVTLSGSGALTGTIGDGISVAFSHYGTARTLMPTTITASYDGMQTQWVAIRPSASIVAVTYEFTYSSVNTGIVELTPQEIIDYGLTGSPWYWSYSTHSGYYEVEFTGGVYYWRNDYSWDQRIILESYVPTEILSGCKPKPSVGVYQQASNCDVFEFVYGICEDDDYTYALIHTDLGELAESSVPVTTPVAVDPGNGAYHVAELACYV